MASDGSTVHMTYPWTAEEKLTIYPDIVPQVYLCYTSLRDNRNHAVLVWNKDTRGQGIQGGSKKRGWSRSSSVNRNNRSKPKDSQKFAKQYRNNMQTT